MSLFGSWWSKESLTTGFRFPSSRLGFSECSHHLHTHKEPSLASLSVNSLGSNTWVHYEWKTNSKLLKLFFSFLTPALKSRSVLILPIDFRVQPRLPLDSPLWAHTVFLLSVFKLLLLSGGPYLCPRTCASQCLGGTPNPNKVTETLLTVPS